MGNEAQDNGAGEAASAAFGKCLPSERRECVALLNAAQSQTESNKVAGMLDALKQLIDGSNLPWAVESAIAAYGKCSHDERRECMGLLDNAAHYQTESANVARMMDALACMMDRNRTPSPVL